MKRTVSFLALAALLLLLAATISAIESTTYRLDWFTPLTSGGGAASSANYAINFTVGQSVASASSSTNHTICLGYWCSGATQYEIYLPLVLRNF